MKGEIDFVPTWHSFVTRQPVGPSQLSGFQTKPSATPLRLRVSALAFSGLVPREKDALVE